MRLRQLPSWGEHLSVAVDPHMPTEMDQRTNVMTMDAAHVVLRGLGRTSNSSSIRLETVAPEYERFDVVEDTMDDEEYVDVAVVEIDLAEKASILAQLLHTYSNCQQFIDANGRAIPIQCYRQVSYIREYTRLQDVFAAQHKPLPLLRSIGANVMSNSLATQWLDLHMHAAVHHPSSKLDGRFEDRATRANFLAMRKDQIPSATGRHPSSTPRGASMVGTISPLYHKPWISVFAGRAEQSYKSSLVLPSPTTVDTRLKNAAEATTAILSPTRSASQPSHAPRISHSPRVSHSSRVEMS